MTVYTDDMTTHETIEARDLRGGDLLFLGGTSCVLIADATPTSKGIALTLYTGNGSERAARPFDTYKPARKVRLYRRDMQPR